MVHCVKERMCGMLEGKLVVVLPIHVAKDRMETPIMHTATALVERELPRAAVDAVSAVIRSTHPEAQGMAGMRKFSFETAINSMPTPC